MILIMDSVWWSIIQMLMFLLFEGKKGLLKASAGNVCSLSVVNIPTFRVVFSLQGQRNGERERDLFIYIIHITTVLSNTENTRHVPETRHVMYQTVLAMARSALQPSERPLKCLALASWQDSLPLGDRREIVVLGLSLTAAPNATQVTTAYASVDVSVSNALSRDLFVKLGKMGLMQTLQCVQGISADFYIRVIELLSCSY